MHGKFPAFLLIVSMLLAAGRSTVWAWQDEPPVKLAPTPAKEQPLVADPDEPTTIEPTPVRPDARKKPAAPARGEESETTEGVAIEDVRSASFQNVRPGETAVAEVRKILGDAMREDKEGGVTTLVYRIEPFAKIEVLTADDVTTSIVIHLKRPTPAAQIAKDLELDSFRPAPIPDEAGQLLGIAYPERGVTLGLVPDGEDNLVSQVHLEPISAEPFVLRALYDNDHRYEHSLADLKYAVKLAPMDPRAPWLMAGVLLAMGDREAALASAETACKLDPESGICRITLGAMLAECGDVKAALAETREALALKGLLPEVRSKAECQLGDLLSTGLAKNQAEAVEHYQAAIKLAIGLSSNKNFAVRRTAKQVLVDAHLGMASVIARGQWKGKAEVAPKWLARAEAFAADFVEADRGDSLLKLVVARKTLATQVALRADADPTAAATVALAESKQLLEGDRDPYFLRQTAWELARAMHEAARAEQTRGNSDMALQYLVRVITLVELDLDNRKPTGEEKLLLGRLYFVGGSVQALQRKSHEEAVVWFDKGAPLLCDAQPPAQERGLHGEQLVSMGVSYWESGSKDEGFRLTKLGVEALEEAVGDGMCPKEKLAVPYGNLASMFKSLGQETKAREYAALAAKSSGEQTQRR